MMNELTAIDKEMFILGKPVPTTLGLVRFLTYEEYLTHMADISVMRMNVLHIYYQFRTKENPIEELKKESLFNIVTTEKSFVESYFRIFSLVLDMQDSDEAIEKTLIDIFNDEKTFMSFRNLVMEMNMISESQVSGNETVQSFIEKDRERKAREAGKTSVSDIVSSIVVGSGIDYDKLADMTVLQVFATYYRVAAIFAYQTTTLFATVSETTVESWSKHVDLFEKEQAGMKMVDFNKSFGNLF